MNALANKFKLHAEILKETIEGPKGNHGDDTAAVNFIHDGDEYTVTVTSNSKILSASLWKGSWCMETVMGKDGTLFVGEIKL